MSTRSAAFDLLRVWQAPHGQQDTALLVTELVADVVDHAGGGNQLTVVWFELRPAGR